MRGAPWTQKPIEPAEGKARFRPGFRWLGLMALVAALAGAGIVWSAKYHGQQDSQQAETKPNAIEPTLPTVKIIRPQMRSLSYTVIQPGFVDAYEQTSIYAKVSGFIKKFCVDIGQEVKTGQLLAEIFVPELQEEHQQKLAQVELDRKGVAQADELVTVAESRVQAAKAQLAEARANVSKSQADVVRWESEMKRMTQMVADRVMDRQQLDETRKQLDAEKADVDAAQAGVAARQAAYVTSQADLAKAKIDVEVAKAKVKVSEAEERRAAALLAYTKVTAPYDAVVTVRNANTGDYVQAASAAGGDRSAGSGSMPMFVIARTDLVRVFVDVPEAYARYVRVGTKAVIRTEALNDLEFPATVTRTSWSVQSKTRTMRTEIDLPVKDYDGLRPGMYVYAKILIERAEVRAVPASVLAVAGNHTYCFLFEHGKAVEVDVQQGMSDGTWVEVCKFCKNGGRKCWSPTRGDEQIIAGDLNELSDGQAVRVAAE